MLHIMYGVNIRTYGHNNFYKCIPHSSFKYICTIEIIL